VYALKKIYWFLSGLFAFITTLLTLFIVTPIYALIFKFGDKNKGPKAHRVSQLWARFSLWLALSRFYIYGKEKIDPKGTYVFISNHGSLMDIPVCTSSCKNFFKFLSKESLTKVPLFGYIIKNLYITVRRTSMRDRVEAMKKMEAAIKSGISVWLYPEGTRNQTENLLNPFQDGAFHLAIATQTPLAILTVTGPSKILPPDGKFELKPGVIRVYWSDPISTVGMTKADVPMLREKARGIMEEILAKHKD
jgi:1-acyl-sn-glycerol-3-phosphate acyltransferase